MINTVIFDMDGVIIDSEPIHEELSRSFFVELGLNLSDEELNSFTGQSGKNIFGYLKNEYGLSQSVDWMLNRATERFLSHLEQIEKMDPIKGVEPLIEELLNQDIQLILASSSVMRSIDVVLDMFDFHQFFSLKLSGDDFERSKPHPEIFLKAAEVGKTHPTNCVVIEDSRNGVKAAKSAGMKCIGFQNPSSSYQDIQLADLIIECMTELDAKRVLNL